MQNKDKLLNRIAEYEFSIGLRLTHWIRAASIVFLILSGFYLAYVYISPEITPIPVNFMNAKWRAAHQIIGFLLIGALIFKSYLFVFDKKSRKELASIKDFINPKIWIAQIKYYLFLGEHPKLKGVYNPLQFVAYLGFYAMLILICLTGLILYMHVFHEGLGGALYNYLMPVEVFMGGLGNVREIHHILMWGIIIFVMVHVYMATFNAVKGKDGAMDAIASGYRFLKQDH